MTNPSFAGRAGGAMLATALVLALSPSVGAQETGHAGHAAPAAQTEAAQAYRSVMDKMHGDMGVTPTGDADVDFVRGMIPHHQGAIDMARVVLEHGDDPEIRKLAQQVIDAQQAEIAMMQDWLARNGQGEKAP